MAPFNLVFGEDARVLDYLESRLDTKFSPPFTTIGIEQDGRIAGGWLFNDFNGSNIEITVALDRPLTRGMIRAVSHYVFQQLGARRVTARCRESNTKSTALIRRLGFHFEGRLSNYFGDEAALIFGKTSNDARF